MTEPFMVVGRLWFAEGVAQDLETVAFESAEALQAWLDENHAGSPGIWLKLRKKAPGVVALDYAQALDVALCYGWIDGQKAALDDEWWLQRFGPRTARSRWSKINRDKVASLIEQGRMRPPGQAEIDRAKADGRWDAAYDSPRTATVPDDLAAALAAEPAAAEFFETLNRTNRFAILYRVQDAKRPETRARRIEKYVTMLAKGEKPHP
ncbi:YdeI/OmpD-associated family protein [Streptomyces nigra]|uniref:YdeI/OmpD-associated family protein n=1 Tax=Streptomyces nigra TaxID=1827580 RepID=UPI00341973AC